MKKYLIVLKICIFFILFGAYSAAGQAHEAHTQPSDLAISLAFDAQGKLWRTYAKDGFVWVDYAENVSEGVLKNFSAPVKVNQTQQDIKPMGEVRPKIAIGSKNEIYLAWMENLKPRFAGYIWFARSIDGGKTFEPPTILHQDRAEIGHAFESIQVAPNGDVTVVWLDARDLVAAKKSGKSHPGSSVYYAVSKNAGQSFSQEQKLTNGSCECCRIALATKPDNTVVAFFRYVFEGGERDHMVAEIPTQPGQAVFTKRASYGNWKVDGCPHHGGAIASGGEGKDWWGFYLAYFDGQEAKPGLYFTRVDGEAWSFVPPKKFGNHQKQASHPALMSQGTKAWLVWREVDGKVNQIYMKFTGDDGRNWSEPKLLLTAEGKVDYPQLLKNNEHVYLLWNTQHKGLLVQGLKAE
jgi:hypothetical protein